jgi:AraC family transcriptional regulator
MQRSTEPTVTVETELRGARATVQLVHFHTPAPVEGLLDDSATYRLEMSLTPRPRNARACYRESWGEGRVQRLGEIFLVPAGHALRAMSDGGNGQLSIVCQLPVNLVHSWSELELAWTEAQLDASLDITDPTIAQLLRRLAKEVRRPGLASAALVEAISIQLAIEIGRYCAVAAARESPAAGGLAEWRLQLIDERLASGAAPPTLDELAELCRVSVRQLTRGFRASRGCSLGEHVARSRMDEAKRLLARGAKVADVADAVGFNSSSSFSYAFRKAAGLSPRQFRQAVSAPGYRAGRRAS